MAEYCLKIILLLILWGADLYLVLCMCTGTFQLNFICSIQDSNYG